jgi:phage gp29-like protein
MAKQKTPQTNRKVIRQASIGQMERMDFGQFKDVLINETASILSDYIRQYTGIATQTPTPGSGVFTNQDRVLRTQTYQELAWYDLYDELERDPQVNSILTSAKLNVAGLDWSITPYDESKRSQAIADFVQDNLEGMENFTQDLYELMDALGKGFAVSEVIWDVNRETRASKLMNRPQRRFQFDAHTRALKLRTMDDPFYGKPLDDYKFIVHRVTSKYENPFGDALDQTIYWMWLFKRMVTKFWVSNLETATAPIPIVKHPASASSDLRGEALDVARQIRSGSYGRIPDNMEIMWAEAQNMLASNVSYESFLKYCDEQMTKSINGQILTSEGSSSSGNGSRALGGIHQNTQNQRDIFRAKSLSSTLNSTLIKWIVDFNFNIGPNEGYPRFKFNVDEQVDRLQEASIIKTMKEAGWEADEKYINDTFQIPFKKIEAKDPNQTLKGDNAKDTLDAQRQQLLTGDNKDNASAI